MGRLREQFAAGCMYAYCLSYAIADRFAKSIRQRADQRIGLGCTRWDQTSSRGARRS
jgi:hypothetical protein